MGEETVDWQEEKQMAGPNVQIHNTNNYK